MIIDPTLLWKIKNFIISFIIMNKFRQQELKTELYHYPPNQTIEKTIYIKYGKEIQNPYIHKDVERSKNKSFVDPLENFGKSKAFPIDQKLTISQVNTKRESGSFWDLFSCCKDAANTTATDYDDCYVCNRRIFHNQLQGEAPTEDQKPYTSVYRLMGRQEKPIQVFHDRLKNHELVGERWPDE